MAELLHGSDVPYGTATHPLVGRLVPDLRLTTDTGERPMAELMRQARLVLLDLGGEALLDSDAGRWIDVVRARCDNPPADTLLIRPDEHVAWAGGDGLAIATEEWFMPRTSPGAG